jgi:alpha-soluble NSF attachment protein
MAVTCYLKCIECEPEESDHANYYLEAAHCIKKVNTERYIEYSRQAINSFCLGSRLSSAASLAKEVAEKLEEDNDFEESIKFWERAAELYIAEETPTHANQALVKASDLSILTRNYSLLPKAIKVTFSITQW